MRLSDISKAQKDMVYRSFNINITWLDRMSNGICFLTPFRLDFLANLRNYVMRL